MAEAQADQTISLSEVQFSSFSCRNVAHLLSLIAELTIFNFDPFSEFIYFLVEVIFLGKAEPLISISV